jgi:uncharacterized membrane protein SpoIIM required for sporulation
MATLDLSSSIRSLRFRQEREQDWKQLEDLIEKISKDGRSGLSADECLALPRLYRSALSGLSVARTISLDVNLVRYLEALVLKSYMQVYGSRARLPETLKGFFTIGWPQAVRSMWGSAFFAAFIFFGSWFGAHAMVQRNPEWYYALMGGSDESRTPTASRTALCETVFDSAPKAGPCAVELKASKTFLEKPKVNALGLFASFLFTNNAQVSLFCFALGFAFGIPTMYLLFTNGALGGAMTAVFFNKGVGVDFVGWLTIHGTTELLAIILCAAAGLHMGFAAALPGGRRRVDSVAYAGRPAALVAIGGVVMLAVAALLEGFGRQLIQPTAARFAVGGFMLLFWMVYFIFAGRGSHDAIAQ